VSRSASTALLAVFFGGFLAGGYRAPWLWSGAASLVWLVAVLWPADLKKVPEAGAFGLWFCWLALSHAFSPEPLKSLYAFTRWLTLGAFYLLVRAHWGAQERKIWLAGLGIVAAWLALGAAFFSVEGFPMTGFLPPYYNYTTFVLAAAFGAGLALWPEARGNRRVLLGLGLCAAIGMILAAGSRGALLAAGASAVWTLAKGRRGRILAGAAGAALVLLAVVPRSFWLKADKPGSMKRPLIWKAAIEASLDRPILGSGPGRFEDAFMRHNFSSGMETHYNYRSDHAHSEPLEAAAETGWVGLALFVFAIGSAMRRASRVDAAAAAAQGALAAMTVQCLFDNMLQLPALGLLYFSTLACVLEPARAAGGGVFWRVVAAAGLIAAPLAWTPFKLVEAALNDFASAKDPQARLEAAVRAVSLFPEDYGMRENLAKALLSQRPPDRAGALRELEHASRLNPTHGLYWELQAEILASAGRWDKALELTSRALALEPNYYQARLLRAESLFQMGKREAAKEELAELDRRRAEVGGPPSWGHYTPIILTVDETRLAAVRKKLRS
jgi:O-antigen ligase